MLAVTRKSEIKDIVLEKKSVTVTELAKIFSVTFNEPQFQGHFPHNPVMPGVLIIEALAQVGSVAMLSVEGYKGKTGYFGGINNCKFKQMVRPGDKLRLECEIIKQKGPVGIGKATATVDGKLAASAELTFMIG